MDWMQIATAAVGIHETPGAAATPEILAFFRDAGHAEVTSDEVAWCAAFVGACLERAGIASTHSLLARSYLQHGQPIAEPRYGAIAVLRRGSDPSSGHVGFVAGWTADTILLLGGNQADAVNLMHFPRERVLAYRWPGTAATPAELDGKSRIVTAANTQLQDGVVVAGGSAGQAVIQAAPPSAPPPGAGLAQLAEQAGHARSLMEVADAFLTFATGKACWIVLAITAYFGLRMAWNASWIRAWRTEDHNSGKTT